MGTHCHYKIYVQHIWGQIVNTKYMYKIYGDRLPIKKSIYGISLITMHGMRAGVHSTLGSSPGNLLFNRDMYSQHSLDCRLAPHHTKKRTSYP